MTNTNPSTGIRYGTIDLHSLDAGVQHELFYGSGAKDLSYEAACEELRAELAARWDEAREEAEIAASETDGNMPEGDRERFIDEFVAKKLGTTFTDPREEYVDYAFERECDGLQIDEPVIEGTYEGVKYRISWLGGAPLVWIIEGPIGYANRLCSPCVPNAANLDDGFYTEAELDEFLEDLPIDTQDEDLDNGFKCYVVPRDWLRQEEA